MPLVIHGVLGMQEPLGRWRFQQIRLQNRRVASGVSRGFHQAPGQRLQTRVWLLGPCCRKASSFSTWGPLEQHGGWVPPAAAPRAHGTPWATEGSTPFSWVGGISHITHTIISVLLCFQNHGEICVTQNGPF